MPNSGSIVDGNIVGLRADVIGDVGAYSIYPWTAALEPVQVVSFLPGPYRVEHYRGRVQAVATSKAPTGPYRGVGRPISTFVMERLIDMAAVKLGMDPKDIRLRNLVKSEEFPYKIGSGIVWDQSGFCEGLAAACDKIGYDALRKRQAEARAAGRWFGIGIATYAELTGIGSRISVAPGMTINTGTETAIIRIDSTGAITASFGIASHGQGLETTLAQVVAEHLGARIEDIRIVQGDSSAVAGGTGTYASRSTVLAGGAARLAAEAVREKVLNAASHLLEASKDDLVAGAGVVSVAGTDRTVTFREVARAVYSDMARLPQDAREELAATKTYDPVFGTTTSATHIVALEIDPETFEVRLDRFVVAEDCGRLINPMIVNGQVHGGVAQGIGAALYEEVVYNDQGQIHTASLVDYLVPSACEVPPIDVVHLETESPTTLGGFRGMGEGGTIGAPAAIANAIADALCAARHRDQRATRNAGTSFPPDRSGQGERQILKERDMDLGLKDKVALVTGAGRGVGREIALSLAAEGASVAINYRSSAKDAEALVAEIAAKGGKAKAYAADVADFNAVKAMVAAGGERSRRPRYPCQQCRARSAQALCRNDAGGLEKADRRLPLWRDPLLSCRRAAFRESRQRPHRQRDRRFLARRRVRSCHRRRRARRRRRLDEIAGARIRPQRHHREHGFAGAGGDRPRQGMGRGQPREAGEALSCAPARTGRRCRADGNDAGLAAQRMDYRADAQHQRRFQYGLTGRMTMLHTDLIAPVRRIAAAACRGAGRQGCLS